MSNSKVKSVNRVGQVSYSDNKFFSDKGIEYNLLGQFYTKEELSTSGAAEISWDNITNVPDSITSGGGGGGIASDVDNDSSVSGTSVKDALETLASRDTIVVAGLTSGYQSADLNISGSLQTEIDSLSTSIVSATSYHSAVYNEIEKLYTTTADVILVTSGSTDLATTISSLTEDQVLEIRSSAVFSPINIPSGVSFKIKVTDGCAPSITGVDCIRLDNGAANVLISSLIIENCSSSYGNGVGSAIGFTTDACKVNDIIFHNLTIRNATESAVMISYNNRYNYALAPTISQMSNRLSFIGCHFYKATTDKIEGSALNLRGIINAFIKDCYINSANLGRGIQIQDSINTVIENNYICNCKDGNGGEGIKIDEIGTIIGYRNTAIIRNNIVKNCIEGIDIDDATSCNIIQNNIVSECSEEGISLDGGTPNGIASIIGNTCYKNTVGIRLESGSVGNLKKNICYNNGTNYLIQNGYSLDDSNTTSLDDCFISSYASLVKNDSSVSGSIVSDALNTLNTTKQAISGGTSRPSSVSLGQMFFDTGLGIPVWHTGSNWVNASGIVV